MNEHKGILTLRLADLRTAVNALEAGPTKDAMRTASEAVIAAAGEATHIPLRDGIELPPVG